MGFLRKRRKKFRIKRWLTFLPSLVLLLIIFSYWQNNEFLAGTESAVIQTSMEQSDLVVYPSNAQAFPVVKKMKYICGEEYITLGTMTREGIGELLAQEKHLVLMWGAEGQAIVEEYVNDLAPECRGNVYFSTDEAGNLTLFEGEPEANNVLQTFFQIDIEYMQSSLPQETLESLYAGIRINDFEEYNSVLSTFASYAVEADSQ